MTRAATFLRQAASASTWAPAPDINFAVRFAGKLNVTQSGPTRFTVGTTDGGVMFLDLDTGPGTNWVTVVDNNRYGGVDTDDHEVRGTGIQGDPPITQIAAPNLAAGAYDFVVGFSGHNDESDGIPSPSNNEAGIEVRWTPAGGGESIIPVAASGAELTFGNNILATENSTINLGTSAFSASFGNVSIDAGKDADQHRRRTGRRSEDRWIDRGFGHLACKHEPHD